MEWFWTKHAYIYHWNILYMCIVVESSKSIFIHYGILLKGSKMVIWLLEINSNYTSRRFGDFSSRLTKPAWRQIWAAISLWGRPAAEKSGIFCPLAIEFITSMVEIPVWIISSGYVLSLGLIELPRGRQIEVKCVTKIWCEVIYISFVYNVLTLTTHQIYPSKLQVK